MNPSMPQPWESMLQPMQALWGDMARPWHSGAQHSPTPGKSAANGAAAPDFAQAFAPFASMAHVHIDPTRLQSLQQEYLQQVSQLWMQQGMLGEIGQDRRFAGAEWQKQPLSGLSAALHLANSRLLMGLAEAMEGDEKTKGRVRFAVEQWAAAAAPSNFLAFNADAQQRATETQGESIARGVQNLLNDLRQGHISMTDHAQFEVGRNVGTTEGAVVFENELFQLIEYKPLTAKVHARPFLMIPACINKYYILDLQPDNSVVRFALEQGHHTFIMSWRNPDHSMAQVTWDD